MADGSGRDLKLTVSYDGTGFWGSQRQREKRTVQLVLERALGRVAGGEVNIQLAGRTDRGVHAVGQVASCADPRPEMTEDQLLRAVNGQLDRDIAVTALRRMPAGFHSRYGARWREYRYRLWSGSAQPLVARMVWHRRATLDIESMSSAARRLAGRYDLASFTGAGEGVPWSTRTTRPHGTVRTILISDVHAVPSGWGMPQGTGQALEFRIVANGFLPHVVRTMAGALDAVGRGVHPPGWMTELIDVADRRMGPPTAPPHGLVLWDIGYDDDVPAGVEGVSTSPDQIEHGNQERDTARPGLGWGSE